MIINLIKLGLILTACISAVALGGALYIAVKIALWEWPI